VVSLDGVGYKAGRRTLLEDISLTINRGECLFVTGANGCGKTLLGNILAGTIIPTSGSIISPVRPGHVSFERQEAVMEEERERDDSRFLDGDGSENPGRSVEEWVREGRSCPGEEDFLGEILDNLDLTRLKDRGLRYLSTGEFRKTMTARALWERADFIIFDDPYDGLDRQAAAYLRGMIDSLSAGGTGVVLLSGKREDMPERTDTLVLLEGGRLLWSGPASEGREKLRRTKENTGETPAPYKVQERDPSLKDAPLVELRDVRVAYGEKRILTDLNWRIGRGEKWLLSGPNGAGKSTLLSLINGDNPKAYGQDIHIFGTKKGSGESVWEIKERIGYLSGDFQLNYRVRTSLLGVILSGYYDSVGLYAHFSEMQRRTALDWMDFCGLKDRGRVSFEELSFGEKRMALIARSLIKSPELLILDEPCQGLDDAHRDRVIALCEDLGRIGELTLLYVTHSDASTPANLNRHLALIPHGEGGFTGNIALGDASQKNGKTLN